MSIAIDFDEAKLAAPGTRLGDDLSVSPRGEGCGMAEMLQLLAADRAAVGSVPGDLPANPGDE